MTIRPALEHDIPQLLSMIARHDESVYKGRLVQMRRGEALQLVAVEDEHVVGQVFLTYFGKATYPMYPDIRDLHVVESHRGLGYGTELIRVCENMAISKGYNLIGLAVNPTLNARARRLYERLGYFTTGDAPYLDGVYDGVEEWVIDMVKKLTHSESN